VEQEVKKENTSVKEKKRQQILVPHDFSDACTCAVSYGILLAQIFRCELTLVHILHPKKKSGKESQENTAEQEARTRLATICGSIQQNNGIIANAYILNGDVPDILKSIVERINAIVLVTGLNTVNRQPQDYFSPSRLVSDYRELRIPLLVVQNKMPSPHVFRHIVLPVDFSKESKEKASWAGYFGKLSGSYTTVVHTEYKDGFFAVQLRNNLMLIKKLFTALNTQHDIHKAEKVKYGIDRYAVSYAKMKGAGLLLITATKEWGVDDYLLGPVEKRIITNEDQLPVMMVNPRDDLFVPCV
jgi:nucleotide-binding universal stress UspA family protein